MALSGTPDPLSSAVALRIRPVPQNPAPRRGFAEQDGGRRNRACAGTRSANAVAAFQRPASTDHRTGPGREGADHRGRSGGACRRSDARRDRPVPSARRAAQRPRQAAFRASRSGASGSPDNAGAGRNTPSVGFAGASHVISDPMRACARAGAPNSRDAVHGTREGPARPPIRPMRMMRPSPVGGRRPHAAGSGSGGVPAIRAWGLPPIPRPIPVPFPGPLPAANLRGPWPD